MRLNLKTAPTVEPTSLAEAKLHLKVDGGEDNALITALIKTARRLAEAETKRAFITQTWQMYLDSAPAEINIPKAPLQSIESVKTIYATQSTVDQNSASGQALLYVAATSGFSVGDTVVVNRRGDREEDLIILSIQEDVSLTMTTNLTETHTAVQADRVERYALVAAERYDVDCSSGSPGRVMLREGFNWPIHRNFASFIVEFKAGYGDAGSDVPEALKEGVLQLIAHLYENRGAQEGTPAARRIQNLPAGVAVLLSSYKVYTL